MIKSFSLSKEEAYIIEKEAKKRGISQSDVIKELLSNLESSYYKQKLEQIENLFSKILKIHKEQAIQNKLLLKAVKYTIEVDEAKKRKIISLAKQRDDYLLIDTLLS